MDWIRQGIKTAERLGTWVLYQARDARDLEHLIGYLCYRIEDFDRRRQRANKPEVRRYYSQRIGHWRRAVRWLGGLDRETYGQLAERVIEAIETHPTYKKLPYVAKFEAAEPGGRGKRAKLKAGPTRRAGRPRVRPQPIRSLRLCGACNGYGTVKA